MSKKDIENKNKGSKVKEEKVEDKVEEKVEKTLDSIDLLSDFFDVVEVYQSLLNEEKNKPNMTKVVDILSYFHEQPKSKDMKDIYQSNGVNKVDQIKDVYQILVQIKQARDESNGKLSEDEIMKFKNKLNKTLDVSVFYTVMKRYELMTRKVMSENRESDFNDILIVENDRREITSLVDVNNLLVEVNRIYDMGQDNAQDLANTTKDIVIKSKKSLWQKIKGFFSNIGQGFVKIGAKIKQFFTFNKNKDKDQLDKSSFKELGPMQSDPKYSKGPFKPGQSNAYVVLDDSLEQSIDDQSFELGKLGDLTNSNRQQGNQDNYQDEPFRHNSLLQQDLAKQSQTLRDRLSKQQQKKLQKLKQRLEQQVQQQFQPLKSSQEPDIPWNQAPWNNAKFNNSFDAVDSFYDAQQSNMQNAQRESAQREGGQREGVYYMDEAFKYNAENMEKRGAKVEKVLGKKIAKQEKRSESKRTSKGGATR